nr:transposase [Neobacillus kokaensis]
MNISGKRRLSLVLGLKFKDPVPHHSTISWNHQHRFKDTNIFQEIFDEIVLLAMNH